MILHPCCSLRSRHRHKQSSVLISLDDKQVGDVIFRRRQEESASEGTYPRTACARARCPILLESLRTDETCVSQDSVGWNHGNECKRTSFWGPSTSSVLLLFSKYMCRPSRRWSEARSSRFGITQVKTDNTPKL